MEQVDTPTAKDPEFNWESPLGRITILGESFPSLRKAIRSRSDGLFDREWMEAYAREAPDEGARWAAKFVLEVWDYDVDRRETGFDLMRAVQVWDDEHRDAFDEWVACPCWPQLGFKRVNEENERFKELERRFWQSAGTDCQWTRIVTRLVNPNCYEA